MKIGDILFGRIPHAYRQRYREELIKTNLSRMFILSVYMWFIQIPLNIVSILEPTPIKDSYSGLFAALSLITMGTGVVFLIIGILCRKDKIKNQKVLQIVPFLLLYLYGMIQMLFFLLNVQAGNKGMNSYVIGIILLSFCLMTKPILNIVNVGLCMGFAMLIMAKIGAQIDMSNSVMLVDTWINLIMITMLVLFMSTLTYYMFVSNFINRVRLEDSVEQAMALARTDTLTGAMNRRGFFEMMEERWPLFKEREVSAVMFDIDYFKEFNDQYGHLAGDNCLIEVASVLQQYFEERGCFCRFGGEEFLTVFCAEPGETARDVIEGARNAVGALNLPESVTVSAGFVTANASETDYRKLISQADIALYISKRSGRNQLSEFEHGQGGKARYARNDYKTEKSGYIGPEKRSNGI